MRVMEVELNSTSWTLDTVVRIEGHETTISRRRGWLVVLIDDTGGVGRGLAAPLPGFSDASMALTGEALSNALFERDLTGRRFQSIADIEGYLSGFEGPPEARHGLEQALLNLLAASQQVEVAGLFEGSRPLRYHRLVSTRADADVALRDGVGAIKVKVNGRHSDRERLKAIADHVRGRCDILVDANGSIEPKALTQWTSHLAALGVDLLEQPLSPVHDDLLMTALTVPRPRVVADESCRTLEDVERVAALGVVDVITIKPMLVGGPLKAIAMGRAARKHGMMSIFTHCFDGPLAQSSVELAAMALPADSVWSVSECCPSGPPVHRAEAALPQPLASAAQSRADHVGWRDQTRTLTYAELADAAARRATALSDIGARPGATIAVMVEDAAEKVVSLHAVGWLGAVVAPLDTRRTPTPELSRELHILGAVVVITDVPDRVPSGPWEVFETAPVALLKPRLAPRTWRLDTPKVALFTSGTSGTSRAIKLNTQQLVFSAFGSACRLGHHLDDVWLACLPTHHVGGLSIILRASWLGITVEEHPRFDPEVIAARLDSGEVTLVSVVPEMLARLVEGRVRGFHTKLRVVLVGGAALPEALRRRCEVLGIPLAVTWGMTETASQVATSVPGQPGGTLSPLNVAAVHTDTEGQLTIRGPVADGGLWRSSDRGHIDIEGNVHVHGRSDRVVISGGENVSLHKIERCLEQLDEVSEAFSVGLDDARWGQRPVTWVALSRGVQAVDGSAIEAHLRDNLPSSWLPEFVVICSSLPKTALNKAHGAVIKQVSRELRERLTQAVRDGALFKRGEVDTRVNVLDLSTWSAIDVSNDLKPQRDRAVAQARDGDSDAQDLPHAHGALEVTLRVDQGHTPSFGVEDVNQGVTDGVEELLIGLVTIAKYTTKERDAGSVDILKTYGDSMLERHDLNSREEAAQ